MYEASNEDCSDCGPARLAEPTVWMAVPPQKKRPKWKILRVSRSRYGVEDQYIVNRDTLVMPEGRTMQRDCSEHERRPPVDDDDDGENGPAAPREDPTDGPRLVACRTEYRQRHELESTSSEDELML